MKAMGNLPNTRLKGNAMITRIQGMALAETGTAQEMLVKVPGMTGSEDKLEVLGKGAPLIYVNGRLLRDRSLTLRVAVVDIFQRNRRNEFADMGYYQILQNNRFSTHKLNLALFYRFNATRSKYKGTGAGVEAQARMGS